MLLAELAARVGATVLAGGDATVLEAVHDSRKAAPGRLFVAMEGLTVDGHAYAAQAAAAGAAVALQRALELPAGAPAILVPDTRLALGPIAAELEGRPARQLTMTGVTGTDGKTTASSMLHHVLEHSGRRSGLLTTVAARVGAEEFANESGQTTMDATDVQHWLRRMVAAGARSAVVEATSHALVQGRVAACDFDVVGVTNVGVDHLDFHATWDAYLEAKATIIDLCREGLPKGIPKTAVLNRDDVSYERLSLRPIERRLTYGIDNVADIRAVDAWGDANGSRFRLVTETGEADVELRLPARFNISNALCAAGMALACGLSVEQVAEGLSTFRGVRGRLESVDLGQAFRVYIDFAHSAGALAAALRELRPLAAGRLILVFGSTARSDHDRPGMGRAAAQGADYFVITTDDPLQEDPAEIARDVQSGAAGRQPGLDYDIVLDRRQAIRRAVGMAGPGDVVLLAGKGHERTMLTAAGKEPWDEREEAEAAIRELAAG